MIPKLQISIFGVDSLCPKTTSGDIYFKEPAFTFSGLLPEVEPKIPKSTIFKSKSNEFYLLEDILPN